MLAVPHSGSLHHRHAETPVDTQVRKQVLEIERIFTRRDKFSERMNAEVLK